MTYFTIDEEPDWPAVPRLPSVAIANGRSLVYQLPLGRPWPQIDEPCDEDREE